MRPPPTPWASPMPAPSSRPEDADLGPLPAADDSWRSAQPDPLAGASEIVGVVPDAPVTVRAAPSIRCSISWCPRD